MRITAFEEQPSALRNASLPRFTEDGMSASLPEAGRKRGMDDCLKARMIRMVGWMDEKIKGWMGRKIRRWEGEKLFL